MYDHERSLVTQYSGKPFALVGVNTDKDLEYVRDVVEENSLIWRSFFDQNGRGISADYKVNRFPTIILIDHKGVIRYINPRDDLDSRIAELVAAAS